MLSYIRQKYSKNPFHIVDPSPWPLFAALNLFGLMIVSVLLSHKHIIYSNIIWINILLLTITILLWSIDIIIESVYLGLHTKIVKKGLNLGFILFIISELLFFIGVFWAYFHSALSPNIELGNTWPPYKLITLNPLNLPLYNTILLLSSGATITYCHYSFLDNNKRNTLIGLILTILLMVIFTICQYFEYLNAPFTLTDGIYGSVFFMGTTLHGLHIIIGLIMLIIVLLRIYFNHWTFSHHIGLYISILYVHFLDIIWLFIFLIFYWWGS